MLFHYTSAILKNLGLEFFHKDSSILYYLTAQGMHNIWTC
jgi:hypothetical protein